MLLYNITKMLIHLCKLVVVSKKNKIDVIGEILYVI